MIFVTPRVQVFRDWLRRVERRAARADCDLRPRQQRGKPRADGAVHPVGPFDSGRNGGRRRPRAYLLDHGDVSIVLRFNHGFAQELRGGRTAPLQIIVHGTDSNTAMIAASYATVIAGDYSQQVLVQRTENANGRGLTANSRELTAPGKTGTADLRIRAWFNENLEARNFFVPAVIVVVVGLSTLLLTSMAVVREKEIGTMEQIMVTPITPAEFILGKTLPFAVIGFIEVSLVTLIGVFGSSRPSAATCCCWPWGRPCS